MGDMLNDNREIWDLFDRGGNRTGETFVRGFGNFRNILYIPVIGRQAQADLP